MIALFLKWITFSLILGAASYADSKCDDYSFQDFKSDATKPTSYVESSNILLYSSLITTSLYLTREKTVYPVQKYFVENKPLGSLSRLGDYSGKSIQNALYVGLNYYDYYMTGNGYSLKKSKLMFKATFFAGLTTTLLKHIAQEERPSGGDKLSFPSGHTTVAFAFSGIYSHFNPKYRFLAHGLAVLTAFSRINDNAHYLHDVVMGAGIGLSYAYSFLRDQSDTDTDKISYILLPAGDSLNFLTYINF